MFRFAARGCSTVAAIRFPATIRGRQSCRFLETSSLHPPLAALRWLSPPIFFSVLPSSVQSPLCSEPAIADSSRRSLAPPLPTRCSRVGYPIDAPCTVEKKRRCCVLILTRRGPKWNKREGLAGEDCFPAGQGPCPCRRLSKKCFALFRQPAQCLGFQTAKRSENLSLRSANACGAGFLQTFDSKRRGAAPSHSPAKFVSLNNWI